MVHAQRARNARDVEGLVLPASTRQLVLVTTDDWQAPEGRLSTWEKDQHERWRRRSPPRGVTVGVAGLAWGRGLQSDAVATSLGGPRKREGDMRAPAGIFGLSSATGYAPSPPAGTRLPYQHATEELRCVDDPAYPDYNQLRKLPPGQRPAWQSDESMKLGDDQYRLTVFVEHNRDPVLPRAGSCIPLHVWPAPGISSPGCTMMSLADMEVLLKWLDPGAHPVVVQLPRALAEKAVLAWGLPAALAPEGAPHVGR
jgi:L,D-peptidoglycan transpeptidase YkuD (ErfK/YbiS/YcfS/YnhG family)